MTGILKKAMRGAMTAGADIAMEEHRASIQAKRDARLQSFQSSDRAAEQEFRTSERVASEKHDLNMLKERDKVGGGATQGDIQLMNYFQEHGIAKSPEDAFRLVREMDTDPSKVIIDIAKGMHAIDDSKSFDEHLKQAETDVKSLRERLNPPKPAPAAPVKDKPAGKGIIGGAMGGGSMIDQAIDSAMEDGVGAAPAAPQMTLPPVGERKVGQRYDTPRGPAVWRDGGWELLNVTE